MNDGKDPSIQAHGEPEQQCLGVKVEVVKVKEENRVQVNEASVNAAIAALLDEYEPFNLLGDDGSSFAWGL